MKTFKHMGLIGGHLLAKNCVINGLGQIITLDTVSVLRRVNNQSPNKCEENNEVTGDATFCFTPVTVATFLDVDRGLARKH